MNSKILKQYDDRLTSEMLPFSQMDKGTFAQARRKGNKFWVVEEDGKIIAVVTYKISKNPNLILGQYAWVNSNYDKMIYDICKKIKEKENCNLMIVKIEKELQDYYKEIGFTFISEGIAYV